MWQHKGEMVDLSKKLPQAFKWTFFLVFKVFFMKMCFWMVIIGQCANGDGAPSRKQNKKGMEDPGKGLNLDEVWHLVAKIKA